VKAIAHGYAGAQSFGVVWKAFCACGWETFACSTRGAAHDQLRTHARVATGAPADPAQAEREEVGRRTTAGLPEADGTT
jgi:hypothetical protein